MSELESKTKTEEKIWYDYEIEVFNKLPNVAGLTKEEQQLFKKLQKRMAKKWVPFEEAQKEIDAVWEKWHDECRKCQAKSQGAIAIKQVKEANKIIEEPNTRPTHKWIINNLDKSEQIEFAFKKLERQLERLRVALQPLIITEGKSP